MADRVRPPRARRRGGRPRGRGRRRRLPRGPARGRGRRLGRPRGGPGARPGGRGRHRARGSRRHRASPARTTARRARRRATRAPQGRRPGGRRAASSVRIPGACGSRRRRLRRPGGGGAGLRRRRRAGQGRGRSPALRPSRRGSWRTSWAELRHAGLVRSQRGADGGYRLAREPGGTSPWPTSSAPSRGRWPPSAARGPGGAGLRGRGRARCATSGSRYARACGWVARAGDRGRPRRRAAAGARHAPRARPRRAERAARSPAVERPSCLFGPRTDVASPRGGARREAVRGGGPADPDDVALGRRSSTSASWRASCTGSRRPVAELRARGGPRSRGARRARPAPPGRRGFGVGRDADVVRAHERVPCSRATGPRKPMTNSLAGCVVDLPRRADLLDAAGVHARRPGRRPPSPPLGRG